MLTFTVTASTAGEYVANFNPIPYEITARRPGDIATCYADASKAKAELGWEAKYEILEMCEDSWRWQKNNPEGY